MKTALPHGKSPEIPVRRFRVLKLWDQFRSGAIAHWPSSDRCLFISVIVLALYLYAAGLMTYLVATLDRSPFFDPAGVAVLQQACYLAVAGWALLALIALIARRRPSNSAWFIHTPIQLYALSSAFVSYMLGPVTTPFFAFAFLGGMLVSLPLFGRRPTFWGAVSMAGLIGGATVAELLGVIPYAPVLRGYPMDLEAGTLSPVWLVGLGSFEVVALGLAFVLATLLIDQLRQRERALVERGKHLREVTKELELLGSTLTGRNEQLEGQAEELAVARDAAQESDAAKSRFLSRVSHETRTPLSGILGFTELLEGRHFGELNERQATYVRHIRESGDHLLDLINDLLDVTQLDSGSVELSLEEVPPAELVSEVVKNLELGARDKGIAIFNEVGWDAPSLLVDRRRFRQILYNLLSNALKFTPSGGEVGVRWRREPENWLCLEVWDNGIGIAPEDVEPIFEEFHQADRKRDEALGGSGLGLALTRRLLELHGGHVHVESELGRGSQFHVSLPLPRRGAEAGRPSQQQRSETPDLRALAPGTRVLVAEDNPAHVAVIRGLLQMRGIDPIVARSGPEAVTLVRRANPQLVLMDIQIPGCDGFEALAQIRTDGSHATLPVVAMTASASEEDRARYLEAGFDGFLSKPIDSHKLDDQLQRFMPPTAEA